MKPFVVYNSTKPIIYLPPVVTDRSPIIVNSVTDRILSAIKAIWISPIFLHFTQAWSYSLFSRHSFCLHCMEETSSAWVQCLRTSIAHQGDYTICYFHVSPWALIPRRPMSRKFSTTLRTTSLTGHHSDRFGILLLQIYISHLSFSSLCLHIISDTAPSLFIFCIDSTIFRYRLEFYWFYIYLLALIYTTRLYCFLLLFLVSAGRFLL